MSSEGLISFVLKTCSQTSPQIHGSLSHISEIIHELLSPFTRVNFYVTSPFPRPLLQDHLRTKQDFLSFGLHNVTGQIASFCVSNPSAPSAQCFYDAWGQALNDIIMTQTSLPYSSPQQHLILFNPLVGMAFGEMDNVSWTYSLKSVTHLMNEALARSPRLKISLILCGDTSSIVHSVNVAFDSECQFKDRCACICVLDSDVGINAGFEQVKQALRRDLLLGHNNNNSYPMMSSDLYPPQHVGFSIPRQPSPYPPSVPLLSSSPMPYPSANNSYPTNPSTCPYPNPMYGNVPQERYPPVSSGGACAYLTNSTAPDCEYHQPPGFNPDGPYEPQKPVVAYCPPVPSHPQLPQLRQNQESDYPNPYPIDSQFPKPPEVEKEGFEDDNIDSLPLPPPPPLPAQTYPVTLLPSMEEYQRELRAKLVKRRLAADAGTIPSNGDVRFKVMVENIPGDASEVEVLEFMKQWGFCKVETLNGSPSQWAVVAYLNQASLDYAIEFGHESSFKGETIKIKQL